MAILTEPLFSLKNRGNLDIKNQLNKKFIGIFLSGFLWGITFSFIFVVIFFRYSLINEYQSKLSFDNTLKAIKKDVKKENGWVVRFNKSCSLPKSKDNLKIIQIELCNNKYGSLLIDNELSRKASSIIPCKFSVYEKSDGKTYISHLNRDLIGYLLGGNCKNIFSRKIAPEQHYIFENIIKK